MKKSQRARLSILAAKDPATLTSEEKAELTALQALTAANPDASKDTDDTVAATPTLASVIKGAMAGFGDRAKLGTDLAQARAELATANAENANLRTQVADRDTQIAARDAQLGAFAAFFGVKSAELAGKSTAELSAILAQKISDSAIEQLASAGVPAAQLPKNTPASGKSSSEALDELQSQMLAERDPEKLGALAAKANRLRDGKVSGNN